MSQLAYTIRVPPAVLFVQFAVCTQAVTGGPFERSLGNNRPSKQSGTLHFPDVIPVHRSVSARACRPPAFNVRIPAPGCGLCEPAHVGRLPFHLTDALSFSCHSDFKSPMLSIQSSRRPFVHPQSEPYTARSVGHHASMYKAASVEKECSTMPPPLSSRHPFILFLLEREFLN
ncbi:hypothetical protein BDW22DRAFT_1211953 [Trametopsis cervina]|nr:hypothetical protein BDW22DRAFT_1211953 [Trametopsis cervina]